jgi:hypothetical protein
MSTIADVVKLRSGYANFVKLRSAFEECKENAERMAMYRPTKAHRRAFERICRGLYQPNDKKFYLLSGSYGTGKSHLCLMLANVLSRASGDPDIKAFYEGYVKLDAEQGTMIRNVRKNGQYLVAMCDYASGKKFEDAVLKAILDACVAAGLDAGTKTEFNEAERMLADWEKKAGKGVRNFYADFKAALEKVTSGVSVDQVRAGLKEVESDALSQFKDAFRETMGGIEFQPQAGNLISIVKEIVKSAAFKDRFKGIAIFFDEFGYTLEKHTYSTDVLQGFMEDICQRESNVIFVGCIHKDFKAYADRLSKADVAVLDARKTDVTLANEGIEEIIGAIVETQKDAKVWAQEIDPKKGIFDSLVPVCKTLKLFPWIDDVDRIRQRVLEDIYGVHPMSLACLLRLSSEIGSDVRSTFTFFSGDVGGAEGSYADFIAHAPITISGGKLNLYRVEQLFEFFQRELSHRNPDLREPQRQLVNGYYASVDALRKSMQGELFDEQRDERVAILKTVLIYQLSQPAIPTTLENIQFGMYCLAKNEEKQVETHLKYLARTGALFFRQQSNTYELAVGAGDDPYLLIERYLADARLHPQDKIVALLEEAPDQQELDFLRASQHNVHFGEDKRFSRYFVAAKDLGPDLWTRLHKEWLENLSKDKKSAEGAVVYALCEDDAAVQQAKNAIRDIPYANILVSVPHNPQPFTEMLLKVKACRHYLPPNEAEKISAQTEARLRDIFEDPQDGYLTQLHRIMNDILSAEKAAWYGQNGKMLVDQPKQPHRPADMLCDELFKRRCKIKHPDLNLSHDDKWRTGKNTALKQAVAVLLDTDQEVQIDNGNPDNHGQKRYLEKVLLKGAGALLKTTSDGPVTYFECECESDKISDDFPVLRELCRRLAEQKTGSTLSVGSFIDEVKEEPYGAGPTAIILSLALAVRAFGERLRIFKDSTKSTEHSLRTFEELSDLVADASTKVVIEVLSITAGQAKLVEGIAQAVHAPALKHGEKRTLQAAHAAITKWWVGIPDAAKIIDIYEKAEHKRLRKLRDCLGQAARTDRFELLLEKLPSVYTGEMAGSSFTEKDAEKVSNELANDVKLFETGLMRLRNEMAEALSIVMGSKGDLRHCETLIAGWYDGLNPTQRDALRFKDDEDAYCVMQVLGDSKTDFETKLMTGWPSGFGFGSVVSWTSSHVEEFAAKFKQAKKVIDEAKVAVPKIKIQQPVYKVQAGECVVIETPLGAAGFIYTTDGEDPKKSENAKKVGEKADLALELKEQQNILIKIRPFDEQGNTGDLETFTIVNREKEYDVVVDSDLVQGDTGSFKFPEDLHSLAWVLKSLVAQSLKKKIIDRKQADKLNATISAISEKPIYTK